MLFKNYIDKFKKYALFRFWYIDDDSDGVKIEMKDMVGRWICVLRKMQSNKTINLREIKQVY